MDLDCDGWADLLVSSHPPRVLWGAEAGFSASNYQGLQEWGILLDNALADLDRDGDLDVVFSRLVGDDGDYATASMVLYTTGTDPWRWELQELPTVGAHGLTVADVNADDWPDLVFSQHQSGDIADPDAYDYEIDSYVYLGGAEGFSEDNRLELPTTGAFGNGVADLDDDGHQDIVFTSYHNWTYQGLESWIYWGSEGGFSEDRRTGLQVDGCRDVHIEDLDDDGWLDLLMVSHTDGESMQMDSFVYWGSQEGFSDDRRSAIPTYGAHTVAVEDLDHDGWRDLVFSNQRGDMFWDEATPARIYRGSGAGWTEADMQELDSPWGTGLAVVDLDVDGWHDIVIGSFYPIGNYPHVDTFEADTWLYGGGSAGFSDEGARALFTGATHAMSASPGEQGF